MAPTLSDLLAVATEAAYLGGRRTLAYFNTGVAVETKSDDTPVTMADREAEQVIRAHIAKAFPSVTPKPPSDWPNDRFDIIWTFTKTAEGWQFAQVPELVLPGDQDTAIKN